MAKDRTDSEPEDLIPEDQVPEENSSDQDGNHSAHADPKTARAVRLAAIKAAVDAGDYDSDELLEIALKKMIQRLPGDHDD